MHELPGFSNIHENWRAHIRSIMRTSLTSNRQCRCRTVAGTAGNFPGFRGVYSGRPGPKKMKLVSNNHTLISFCWHVGLPPKHSCPTVKVPTAGL
jgi:hypothetical protein